MAAKTSNVFYTAFKTPWGWFTLASSNTHIIRTILPLPRLSTAKDLLLKDLPHAQLRTDLLPSFQKQIIEYFNCPTTNLTPPLPLAIDHFTPFARKILTACRIIPPGHTTTYARLASSAGRPKAARTAGSALAKNPLPLIIPCHRVILSSGQIGPFSPYGPKDMKQKLIDHEKTT